MPTTSVLWVEDHGREIQGIYTRLINIGVLVSHRQSRDKAEQFLRQQQCDYIILDLWMKDDAFDDRYSGAHLLRRLRDGEFGEWGRHVPVVLYTAHGKLAPAAEWIWKIEPGLDGLVHKGNGTLEDLADGLIRPLPSVQVLDESSDQLRLRLVMQDEKADAFRPILTRDCAHAVLSSSTHDVPATLPLRLNEDVTLDLPRRVHSKATNLEIEIFRKGARTDHFLVTDEEP